MNFRTASGDGAARTPCCPAALALLRLTASVNVGTRTAPDRATVCGRWPLLAMIPASMQVSSFPARDKSALTTSSSEYNGHMQFGVRPRTEDVLMRET